MLARSFPWKVTVTAGVVLGLTSFVVVQPGGGQAISAAEPPSTTVPPQVTTTLPVTTSTTVPAPTTTPVRGELVIQGVGDVNFDPTYITAFAEEGYDIAFAALDGVFLDDDLTVINLECPPTDAGTQLDKDYSFRCDPAALPVAAANGVDVANLANNHGQDRGVEGLLDSIVNVREAGIAPVGVGSDVAEATTPAIIERDGWTIAVLGMGGVLPSDGWLAGPDKPGMASGDDIEQMTAAVRAASEQADIVVVTIHWGVELVTEPDAEDRARAAAMIEAGADVVFGHHAHRLGELEYIDGVPVFWTLGNFIWPRLSDPGATTAIGRVVVSPDGAVEACLVPAFIERSGRPELRGEPSCRGER